MSEVEDQQIRQIRERQDSFETELRSISKIMGRLVSTVDHLSQSQEAIFSKFDRFMDLERERTDREHDRNKTPWQTIIAAASFALLFGAAVLAPIYDEQTKAETERKGINMQLMAFAEFMGASKARANQDRQRIDNNEERTNAMLQNRFTDDDGAILRNQTMQRINQIEERVFNRQSAKGGHE